MCINSIFPLYCKANCKFLTKNTVIDLNWTYQPSNNVSLDLSERIVTDWCNIFEKYSNQLRTLVWKKNATKRTLTMAK